MKDLKVSVNEFLKEFHSRKHEDLLRHAIGFNIKSGKVALKVVKIAQDKLNDWYGKRLYAYGEIIGDFKTISNEMDYGFMLGIGYDVKTKKVIKDKINVGRYLVHLLLFTEGKEREIENLKREVQSAKETYLDMENVIREILADKKVSEGIKDKFSKFYWLKEDWKNEE